MNVMNCRKCRKLFQYSGFGPRICPECVKKEEEKFKVVKEYLYENPGAVLPDVANATHVEPELIQRFLREGRLEIASNSAIEIPCENCGKPIKSGRFCDECSRKLASEMKAISGSAKQDVKKTGRSDRDRMHVDFDK